MPRSNMTTLCYIENGDSYLMMHRVKKDHDVNKDKWIGVGGHFEAGESPEECLLREVKEETGLILTSFRFRGIVTFTADEGETEYMCLYTADQYKGSLSDCSEGSLEWVNKNQILNLNLWEGDKIFFDLLDADVPFFSLKLEYQNNCLREACLNGRQLELLDERHKDGTITGKVGARYLMHKDGTSHATAHVWVVRPNDQSGYDILLQKRSEGKDAFPGCYDISSAGHVPAGEEYMESALRELNEELGIAALPEELIYIGLHDGFEEAEFYGRPFVNHEISKVYLYKKPVKIESLILQAEEVESVIWMDFQMCLEHMQKKNMRLCLNQNEMEMLGKALGIY